MIWHVILTIYPVRCYFQVTTRGMRLYTEFTGWKAEARKVLANSLYLVYNLQIRALNPNLETLRYRLQIDKGQKFFVEISVNRCLRAVENITLSWFFLNTLLCIRISLLYKFGRWKQIVSQTDPVRPILGLRLYICDSAANTKTCWDTESQFSERFEAFWTKVQIACSFSLSNRKPGRLLLQALIIERTTSSVETATNNGAVPGTSAGVRVIFLYPGSVVLVSVAAFPS